MRFYTFGATPLLVLEECYVPATFGYVWITFVMTFLQFLCLGYTFGYVSCDSCVKTHDTLQIIKQTSKIVGSCLGPFVGAFWAIRSSTGLSIMFGYV